MSWPWPGPRRQASSSCDISCLSISMSQFLASQCEFREHVRVSKGAAPSVLSSNAASESLSPSLPVLFPRSTFYRMLPLHKCQAAFSHCPLTKSSAKGGRGHILSFLAGFPCELQNDSLHVLQGGAWSDLAVAPQQVAQEQRQSPHALCKESI